MTIDVVLPTHDRCGLLCDALEHLARQTAEHTVIVVDNGSTDGSAEMVAREHPGARLVHMGRNAGFAPAVNAGIRAGDGEVVVVINNDVNCEPEFVERIAAPLREDDRTGMVAGLQLQPRSGLIDGFGLEVDRTLTAFSRLRGEPRAAAREAGERGLTVPSGGAAAYRRSAVEAVGGLDERIFAYHEDVDLGLRLGAAGWRCAAAPDAAGVHLGSASFGFRSSFQSYHWSWSRAYLLRKYGVLGSRRGMAEVAFKDGRSVAWQALRHRDLAPLHGRRAGWAAAAGVSEPLPRHLLSEAVGPWESLRRRGAYQTQGGTS